MLEMSHNHWLVIASLAVAMMAGFTGLSLLRGASQTTVERRKFNVALASIAMGGGIWSMHFVAMLGLELPIHFYYDFLTTLASALLAILALGMALLILHFVKRDRKTMTASGALVGLGIVVMHYLGMSGMTGAVPNYTLIGVVITVLVAVTLGVTTFLVAYGKRNSGNILSGTLFFGLAVFAVHFVAMLSTSFTVSSEDVAGRILIDNQILAIGVSITTFVICGAFLLTGITFVTPINLQQNHIENAAATPGIAPAETSSSVANLAESGITPTKGNLHRLPFEKDGRSHFVETGNVCVIRAEGHYTLLYTAGDKLFCPFSISEVRERLKETPFINCHRSYLINPDHVTEFERKKDNGVCYFEHCMAIEKVPVSRSKLKIVQQALGLN